MPQTNLQLPLQLQLQQATKLSDFVAGNNQVLIEHLSQQLGEQAEPLIFISGEQQSGLSHLLLGQCHAAQSQDLQVAYLPCREITDLSPQMLEGLEQLDFLAIDDVQLIAKDDDWEEALFGLFNAARDRGCRMLISANTAPSQIDFNLADLQSRLSWGVTYRLQTLNDEPQQQLLINLAKRRGLEMPLDVARYIIDHQQRGTANLLKLIEQLDQASLAEQRKLTIPFIRQQIS